MSQTEVVRHKRQMVIKDWVARVFGASHLCRRERTLRFVEEAIELAQACGLERKDVDRVLDYVFARPKGEVAQEVGGVSVCLLALCSSTGLSADVCEDDELSRILILDPAKVREKSSKKVDAGIAMHPDVDG